MFGLVPVDRGDAVIETHEHDAPTRFSTFDAIAHAPRPRKNLKEGESLQDVLKLILTCLGNPDILA